MNHWLVRTVVPLLAGLLCSAAAVAGLHITTTAAAAVATTGVTLAYTVGARLVEQRWPAVGSVLLAAGLTNAQPVYMPPSARRAVGAALLGAAASSAAAAARSPQAAAPAAAAASDDLGKREPGCPGCTTPAPPLLDSTDPGAPRPGSPPAAP